jgi:NAD(P)-dependent dehydrogenase (short-subunit alcohol dehydrogenase family)
MTRPIPARPSGAPSRWTAHDIPDQTSRTVVVTGGNSGLGLRSAEALAAKGARVLLACRNETKAQAALDEVRVVATAAEPEVVRLDLADLG